MTRNDLARLIVRLQGACFLVWAIVEISYIGPEYRDFKLVHEYPELDEGAKQAFAISLLRIALQVGSGLVLLLATERVISFFVVGRKSLGRKITEDDGVNPSEGG